MAETVVGIDAGPLLGRGGISGYVTPLVHALVVEAPDLACRLLLRRSWAREPAGDALRALAPVDRVSAPDRVLAFYWDRLARPALFGRRVWSRYDVFLGTCLLAPVLPRGRVVSIVYDLTPLRLPELFPDHARFRTAVERVVRRSHALVAISQRTRDDLVALVGADPARIRVIHAGRRPGWAPPDQNRVAETARRLGLHGPYVLYVGSLGPHKNVSTLLRAYRRARREYGLDARLVLAGSARWGASTLAELERLDMRDDVVLAGDVADADLPALYAGAQQFVFPSRWEGFGLPVLEAMTCGAPVIVSSAGALPEVAGDAAIVVAPDDEAGFAAAMARLAADPAERARRARLALERAAAFSWQASARALAAVLREAAVGAPPTALYGADYFEGRTRQSPPHSRELIYPLAERTAAFLARRLRPRRAVDVGCAKGFLVEALRAAGIGSAVGVDISHYAVSRQEAGAAGRLVVADAGAALPLRSESCDLVVSLDLFEHLPDPRPVLAEMRRVLDRDGTAYLKICHPRHPNAHRDPTHVNVQPIGYWRRIFRDAGFVARRVYETDVARAAGLRDRLAYWPRRWREWAVIGTPADYKFLLTRRA
ncbi:MAG TPA: glycosyltransferase [Methylomirabilota bacterium]|jgi:glycosyltransferase involved in cell wall biosynthesis/SAM-dependent methyltransferase|nr:glycosyltransferase [Methylomirabilota bacterium]